MVDLWDPVQIGNLTLPHRLAMSPMTRNRALPDGRPGPMAAEYYQQRAGLGLLITEGTQPSDAGQGYLATPGIYTQNHIDGWREVTSAVHEAGGHIFIQLMHVGRIAHPDNTPHHRQPVAPSAIGPGSQIFTLTGLQDIPTPRALSMEEIRQTIQDFRHAARCAIKAGADGVEIHGANGYLVHQFLAAGANQRTDIYGGSIENRTRFAFEVAAGIAEEIGPERTAIRLSPGLSLDGIQEGDEGPDVYRYLVSQLNDLNLAYLHIMQGDDETLLQDIRKRWKQPLLLVRPGRPLDALGQDVASGLADVEPVGRWALANPDFVERLKTGAGLNEPDPATFYGGDAQGYIDYPLLETQTAK